MSINEAITKLETLISFFDEDSSMLEALKTAVLALENYEGE